MRKISKATLLMVLVCLGIGASVSAEVRLPAIIGDNMVLQQGPDAPIWGWADPKEKITVKGSWPGAKVGTTADDKGKWTVLLGCPKAGGPYTVTVSGTNTITINNVLCGEVWVCSGQSNMQWAVQNSNNSAQEIAGAKFPQMRLFTVARKVAETPQENCGGKWEICSPETVPGFSAAAYFFGRELHQTLKVPFGLINTSWGGTPAEAWTRRDYLAEDENFRPIVERFKEACDRYPQAMKDYKKRVAEWKKKADEAKAAGKRAPRRPGAPFGPGNPNSPSGLYNGMIAPLVPYGIRGAIWYQGESNTGRAWQYRTLFPAMIRNWREDWGREAFPFLFVQIAPYKGYWDDRICPELQEAQLMTLTSSPNTGMAVTTDIGNLDDIHPKNKQDVGKRLALWALVKAYGRALVCSGPLYRSMQVEGNTIRLSFDYAVGGLECRGDTLSFFTIAGEDQKFVPAKAVIEEETVVVSSETVAKPAAVRFGWTKEANPNLFNREGLPASPFRTDDWPGVTYGKK